MLVQSLRGVPVIDMAGDAPVAVEDYIADAIDRYQRALAAHLVFECPADIGLAVVLVAPGAVGDLEIRLADGLEHVLEDQADFTDAFDVVEGVPEPRIGREMGVD